MKYKFFLNRMILINDPLWLNQSGDGFIFLYIVIHFTRFKPTKKAEEGNLLPNNCSRLLELN